ncbi:MAG: phospho-sugar mutase [Mycobacterium leprae]
MKPTRGAYLLWLSDPYFDPLVRTELLAICGNEEAIDDRFGRELAFDTGGVRALTGAGTARINRYTMRQAAAGLAAYVSRLGTEVAARGVVIGCDVRADSPTLALEAALTLCAAGIRVFLWGRVTTTPLLSFAVRELQAMCGMMVTASHNPPAYNGYKLLWEDGAQVDPQRAAEIAAAIRDVGDIRTVRPEGEKEARSVGLLLAVPPVIVRRYRERLLALAERFRGGRGVRWRRRVAARVRVLYTPLYGAAAGVARQVLTDAGFQLAVVEEQAVSDPTFGGLLAPNPEEPAVYARALEQATAFKPDLIVATDPDGDRLGAMAWSGADYRQLSGNQVGALLTDYLLTRLAQQGRLPRAGVVIKSVTSTNLVAALCREHRVGLMETEVGFRHIGARIRALEQHGTQEFLFGFEESGGYLAATFLREKDGVMAALLLADAAAYHKARGHNLWQALDAIWRRCGYFLERQATLHLPGRAGGERMTEILARLAVEAPPLLGGIPVAAREEGNRQIRFRFADGGFAMVRPSGTEPKLKAYCSVRGDTHAEAEQKLTALEADLLRRLGE